MRVAREERIVLGPLGDDQAAAMVDGPARRVRGFRRRSARGWRPRPRATRCSSSSSCRCSSTRDGGSRRTGGWSDAPPRIRIPPTIEALVAARLDRLGSEERAVVEPASVIGLTFPEPALSFLAPEAVRPTLAGAPGRPRSQAARPPADSAVEGEEFFRFHHLLIRDAAYNGQLKRTRAGLHERFVEWADEVNAERHRGLEFEEILGYHLEQAHRFLGELGPLDEHGVELGVRASERLAAAGHRAFARGDMPATANLLQRAALVTADRAPRRARSS